MNSISFSEAKNYIVSTFETSSIRNFLNRIVSVVTTRNITIAAATITLLGIGVFLMNKINANKPSGIKTDSNRKNYEEALKNHREIQTLFNRFTENLSKTDLDKIFKEEELTFNIMFKELSNVDLIQTEYNFDGGKLTLQNYTNKNIFFEDNALKCGAKEFALMLPKNDYKVIAFMPQDHPGWVYFIQYGVKKDPSNPNIEENQAKMLSKWLVG